MVLRLNFYNNFPWPATPTAGQRLAVEKAAQRVLDAWAGFPGATLADLYDPLAMPPALAAAHAALAWVDEQGRTVTESQHEILRAAACEPATPALPRLATHHTLVQQAVTGIQKEHATTGARRGLNHERREPHEMTDANSQLGNRHLLRYSRVHAAPG
jgi:hypothetical protein